VIIKGGHLDREVTDVLCTRDSVRYIPGTRLRRSPAQRGTGCRYASTLAAYLAQGVTLQASARKAKRAVETALRSGPP
jgi:hydroxymethylpyrimidine/phosphomethylpyrimidine kinase